MKTGDLMRVLIYLKLSPHSDGPTRVIFHLYLNRLKTFLITVLLTV